ADHAEDSSWPPRAASPAGARTAALPAAGRGGRPHQGRSPNVLRLPQRVLVVEDQELARRSLIETLTGAGFRIAGEAASAAVARSLAPRLAYDIALIDIYLKDGDGIDLAAELRAGGSTAKLVIFTCSHKPNDLLRALRAGADGYVTKEAEPDRLLREVAAAAFGATPISAGMLATLVRE